MLPEAPCQKPSVTTTKTPEPFLMTQQCDRGNADGTSDVPIDGDFDGFGFGDLRYEKVNFSLERHADSLYGDINLVNGVPWPRQPVEKRTYRLRFLNVSMSRQFSVKFLAVSAAGRKAWVTPVQIGTDGGLIEFTRPIRHFLIQVAERYEFLLNFADEGLPPIPSGDSWTNVFLVNDFGQANNAPAITFCKSHLLARFDITDTITPGLTRGVDAPGVWAGMVSEVNNIPVRLRAFAPLRNLITEEEIARAAAIADGDGEPDREFAFGRNGGQWAINNLKWEDRENRVIANPRRDGNEVWRVGGGGGWNHPIHVHLIDFLVLNRKGGNSDLFDDYDALTGNEEGFFRTLALSQEDGPNMGVRAFELDAAKDVVHICEGCDIDVLTRFGPNDGDFMFHCHNLAHEDNDMMVAFGVGRDKAGDGMFLKFEDDEGGPDANPGPLDVDWLFQAGTLKDDSAVWVPGPYRDPTAACNSPDPDLCDNLSPYNPITGPLDEISEMGANLPTGLLTRTGEMIFENNILNFQNGLVTERDFSFRYAAVTGSQWPMDIIPVTDDYYCIYLDFEIYKAFYPPEAAPGVETPLSVHLTLRDGVGPIQNNIWAVNWPATPAAPYNTPPGGMIIPIDCELVPPLEPVPVAALEPAN
ncbi:unnamed protein product [Chrysoparadoxa australica]